MFTWMWSQKYRKLSQRLHALKETREETLYSPDLSSHTLAVAPDFWERQHGAVTYVQHQIQRVSGQMRTWGGTILLALLADTIIVMGALSVVQTVGSLQANRAWESQIAHSSIEGVRQHLLDVLKDGTPEDQATALELLNRLMNGQPTEPTALLDPGTVATTLSPSDSLVQSIYNLGRSSSPAAIEPLLYRLGDPRSDVRVATIYALGDVSMAVGDSRGWDALHSLLLNEADSTVRQAAIGTIAKMTNVMGIPN